MNAQRRDELIAVYRDGLLEDTLPFWLPRCVDEEHGGFMIARDRDGSLLDTDNGDVAAVPVHVVAGDAL